jgi:hypothetical protein
MDFFFQGLVTYGRVESFFTMIFLLFFGIAFIIFGGWLIFTKFDQTTATIISSKYNAKNKNYDLKVSYNVNDKTYTNTISESFLRNETNITIFYNRKNPNIISTSNLNDDSYIYLFIFIGLLLCIFGISTFSLAMQNQN